MTERPLVLITQPYIAAYRVALFAAVIDVMDAAGVDVVVAAGAASGDQARRGDEHNPVWVESLRVRSIKAMGRRISWRSAKLPRKPVLVVSELEASNLFAWRALLWRSKLVLWGHGKPYVNDSPWIGEKLEWWLARMADHVMTYADGGRAYLIERGGISPDRVTAIGNSTDTLTLRGYLSDMDTEAVAELTTTYGQGPVALYVGGLDASKRIDFLLEAAIAAHQELPDFKLIVVGKGSQQNLVQTASESYDFINYIPEARDRDLAELSHIAVSMWCPGRVGLVAVDSLALGLPVLTTQFRYHAPEIEFLREDEVYYLDDDPRLFGHNAAILMKALAQEPKKFRSDIPTLQSVAANMAVVLLELLNPQLK